MLTGRDLYGPIGVSADGSASLPPDLASLRGDVRALLNGPRALLDEGWHWKELVAFIAKGSETEASLPTAADSARMLRMRLRLVHILDPLVAREVRLRHPRVHFRDDTYVRNVASDLVLPSPDDPLEVEAEVVHASEPVSAITDFLERHPAAMPFVGARRRAQPLVEPNSLSARVVERSPSPALVVSLAAP